MVTKFSHVTLFVLNQEKAYDVYVNKLGFRANVDTPMPSGYRWLTVSPPDQPELEVVLMDILHAGMLQTPDYPNGIDQESQDAFRVLLQKGVMGAWVMHTPDCWASFEELKAKGLEFRGEPKEQFYGIEAVLYDGCGNWFSLIQPKTP